MSGGGGGGEGRRGGGRGELEFYSGKRSRGRGRKACNVDKGNEVLYILGEGSKQDDEISERVMFFSLLVHICSEGETVEHDKTNERMRDKEKKNIEIQRSIKH